MADQPKDSDAPQPSSSWRRSLQPILTKIAHGSTPFITTFVLIHLSAPVLANLGGSLLSSQVMLLGREYYQTALSEPFLLLLPLALHPLASSAKRVLAPRPVRRLTSVLTITGYSAVLLVAVHYLTHRYYPADPAPPIFALSPSELDFEYVKYALQQWPWRAWFGYVALTACVVRHAAEGMGIIWNTWFRDTFGRWRGTAASAAATTVAVVVPVASGLFVLSTEPLMAFTSSVSRFHAALTTSWLYRF